MLVICGQRCALRLKQDRKKIKPKDYIREEELKFTEIIHLGIGLHKIEKE